ncbi:DUF4241 domain-containing protein [Nonlabens sp. Asnod3-A02]|uniref:DUF4241 domain-containing protein n=1 Tax=Nonlabens sp. Asnod3-A02 TaxID=3160579 RepID=UPI0038644F6B
MYKILLLLLFVFCTSCKKDNEKNFKSTSIDSKLKTNNKIQSIKNSTENDTKLKPKTQAYSLIDYNIFFDNSFVDKTPIEIVEIGNLNLPTGKIVACDGLISSNSSPFIKTVKPGRYPVKIYVAKTKQSGDRNAIVQIKFSHKKAIKWVMALTENENINEFKDKYDYFGFPVDSGLGGLFDYQIWQEYQVFESDFYRINPNKNLYDDILDKEFKKEANKNNWINFYIPNSKSNITMYSSGYGDGTYPSFWGIDEKGEIVSLVIDFLVLLTPEYK